METHKAVFSDVAGKPAGIVAVDFDVTEMRQAQQKLAATAEQLALTLERGRHRPWRHNRVARPLHRRPPAAGGRARLRDRPRTWLGRVAS